MADRRAQGRRAHEQSTAESSTMAQIRNPRRDDDSLDLYGLEARVIAEFHGVGIDPVDERNATTREASREVLGEVIEDNMSGRHVEPPSRPGRRQERSVDPRNKRRASRGPSGGEGAVDEPTPKEVVERKISQLKKRLADPQLDDEARKTLADTLHWHEEALDDRKYMEAWLIKYSAQWEEYYKHVTYIQHGWDEPTPEIAELWLRRHRILDDPWTGKYHWRDYALGRRVPATPAAKAEVAQITEEVDVLLKAWKEQHGKTKEEARLIEYLWHKDQLLIDFGWTTYMKMRKQYDAALVDPIDCSPPPPTLTRRQRFVNYVRDIIPGVRRTTPYRPPPSFARSLGVGEGTYRMRERYFGEPY